MAWLSTGKKTESDNPAFQIKAYSKDRKKSRHSKYFWEQLICKHHQ